MLQVNLFLRSIRFNLGQFDFCFFFGKQKNFFWHLQSFLFILLLFISTLLTSPTIPSLLSQHPSPYSFYLNAYLVSLEPPTFCFPLDSCPYTLPVSHGDFSLNYSNQTCILDPVLLSPKSKHDRSC